MPYLPCDGYVKYNFYTSVDYIDGRDTHQALDIITKTSVPIRPYVPGVVYDVINKFDELPNKNYGNELIVIYDTGIVGRFCHLARNSFVVSKGQVFDIGDTLAMVGRTGYVVPKTVYHTHYEEYKNLEAYLAYKSNAYAKNVRIDPLISNNQSYMGRLEDLEKRVYTDHENNLSVLNKDVNKMKDVNVPDLQEKHKVQASKIKELEKGHKNQAKRITKLENK